MAPEVKVPFSLAQVAVFLAVARTGSTISASLACSISQPAVSKSLNGLEQVLTPALSSCMLPACLTPMCAPHPDLMHAAQYALGLQAGSVYCQPAMLKPMQLTA